MAEYFTHYWKNDTWESSSQIQEGNKQIDHIAGNLFKKRGVKIGDVIYIITNFEGSLYLCGRLIVGKICKVAEAARDLGCQPEELWEADEHIIASSGSTESWDLKVPLEITKQLEFISGNEIKNLKFKSRNYLDQQTLRGVRKLTPESAKKLDKLLTDFPENEDTAENIESNWRDEESNFESSVEGNKGKRFVTKYERNPKLRKQAIQIHGYNCKVCEFNFEKHYGKHGKDFIHVHHIKPLFQFEEAIKVNPQTDLTVLCPNCHSIIHRNKNKTLSIEELKAIYKR